MTHKLTREILNQIKIFEAMGVNVCVSNEAVIVRENEESSPLDDIMAFRVDFFGFARIFLVSYDILETPDFVEVFFTSNVLSAIEKMMEEESGEILSHIQKQKLSEIAGLEENPSPQQPRM